MGATYISADRIADALGKRTATAATSVMRATVAEVPADGIMRVRLDGAAVGDTTECGAYCGAEKGDRVAVVRMPDGRCIATGRRGGDTWETLIGKPEAFPAEHLRSSTELTAGADLNDVLTPGAYRIESNTIAKQIANAPTEMKTAMYILVYRGAFDACITQEALSWMTGVSARRSYNKSTKEWTAWAFHGGSSSVLESGTSGIWQYTKFSDGLVIMYGVATFSTGTWNAWGGMYEASRTWQGSLPVPLIKTGFEVANITLDGLQTASASPNSTQNLSTTKTNIYRPMRATTASSCTARIAVLVVGRWK